MKSHIPFAQGPPAVTSYITGEPQGRQEAGASRVPANDLDHLMTRRSCVPTLAVKSQHFSDIYSPWLRQVKCS